MGFEKLANPETARVAACFLGRQRMVCADDFVAIGDIGARTKEESAVACHVLKEPIVAVCHDLHMLGGDIIGHCEHFIIGVADDHFAVVFPAFARSVGGGQDRKYALDFGHGGAGELLGVGQQDTG